MNQGMINENNENMFPQSVQPVEPQKMPLEYIIYGCIALVVIGCFLPFATLKLLGVSSTTNFVYGNDELLQGAYVVGLTLISFVTVFKQKNYKAVPILLSIALFITIYNYFDVKRTFNEQLKLYPLLTCDFEIGFYMVMLGLIAGIIVSILLLKNSKGVTTTTQNGIPQPTINQNVNMNNAMNPMMGMNQNQGFVQQSQQSVTNNCKYCGALKNDGNFCNSCGSQY